MTDKTYFVVYKGLEENKEHTVKVEIVPFNEELKYLQKLVGGHIEHCIIDEDLYKDHIDMWIDEEGKYKADRYKLTWSICDKDGMVYDAILGNCVFSKFTDEGETVGLHQQEVNRVIDYLLSRPKGCLTRNDGTVTNSVLIKIIDK